MRVFGDIFRSSAFRFSLLAFQVLWLNVIVPGHRRGIVPLPGETCEACRVATGDWATSHSATSDAAACEAGRSSKHSTPADPAAHCSICYFAARLTLPPVVDFTPPALGLAEILPIHRAERCRQIEFVGTYLSRGPPARSLATA